MASPAKNTIASVCEPVQLEKGGWGLAVAGRTLTTPQKNAIAVPSRALAQKLADEWNAAKGMFRPEQMVMTTLVYTAIDRIAPVREAVAQSLLEFLDTDTLCCWSDEPALNARQQADWMPMIEWMRARFGVSLEPVVTLGGVAQDDARAQKVKDYILGLENLEISALSVLAPAYGSLILALTVKEGVTDALAAYKLSALEAEFQAERWGADPDTEEKAARMCRELELVEQFLRLLNHVESSPHTH